jgi:DNA-binding response OmpR family regulator
MNTPWAVLIVDDEPVVREGVARVLADEALPAATAGCGEEALAHPALAGCRLVICDLMLPGMSGLELMSAIRARRADVPILAITGYATREARAAAVSAGATDFLSKPFDPDELLEKVRRVLPSTGVAGKEERS